MIHLFVPLRDSSSLLRSGGRERSRYYIVQLHGTRRPRLAHRILDLDNLVLGTGNAAYAS